MVPSRACRTIYPVREVALHQHPVAMIGSPGKNVRPCTWGTTMSDDIDTDEQKPKPKSKGTRKKPFGVIDGGKSDEPLPGKHPGGRPTKYHPSMLETIITLASNGASRVEIAVELGVTRATLWNWTQEDPEFFDVMEKAEELSQAWWEKMGRSATFGAFPGFNAAAYNFQMKNRFRKDWQDIKQTELTGANGGAIQLVARAVEVDHLDDDQLEALEQALIEFKDDEKAG